MGSTKSPAKNRREKKTKQPERRESSNSNGEAGIKDEYWTGETHQGKEQTNDEKATQKLACRVDLDKGGDLEKRKIQNELCGGGG